MHAAPSRALHATARRGYFAKMSRKAAAARLRSLGVGFAALLTSGVAHAAALFVTSATVQNPGDSAQICVVLSSGGAQVAGTQNDLVWDGTCATLTDPPPCAVAGSHGKQLAQTLVNTANFTFRGIILSFSDTSPIPDGPLYCCSFEGEANPGACCPITVVNAQGSEPGGIAIPLSGSTAQICTAQGSGQSGGGAGAIGGMNPPSASNEASAGATGSGAATAPGAPAAPAAGAVPPVQVLPGGGTRVENSPAEAGAPTIQAPALAQTPGQPGAAAPPPAAAPAAAVAGAPAAAATRAPIAAVTSAPVAAPTNKPTPADTATVEVPVAPTTAPTKAAAAAKPQPAVPPADTSSSTGLFGCQIASGTSDAPLVGFGLLVLVGWAVRGRGTMHRKPDSRTQR
jgi:hypothetical protein